MTAMPVGAGVRLRPLTVVDEGDDVVVGDPAAGTFVTMPAAGGVAVRALLDGASVEEAGARASAAAGEPVDMADFVETLTALGFVDTAYTDNGHVAGDTGSGDPPLTAAWPPARVVRPLFSRVAWCLYGLAALWVVGCFVARPDLWPRPADVQFTGDLGTSLLILLPATYLLVALHEMGHWLAARALDLRARFGIDRRLFFLVIETDLSQLWSVPRRQRYGPQLAGLAIDMVVLGLLLAAQLAGAGGRVAPALVFVLVVSSLWQCMVFLRTDVYGVLVTATGCHDLWRVSSLLMRRALGRLDADRAAELSRADPGDVRVGRWFRWVRFAGYPLAGAYLVMFYVPLLVHIGRWAGDGVAAGPGSARFWWGVLVAVGVYTPVAVVTWLWLRSLRDGSARRG